MPHKVFWSWQSDRPGNVARHFVKGCLEKALVAVGEELGLDESDRPGLDHDTKDEPGLVSIPESILAKIDAAAVFVGDLSPVAKSDRGRWVANPNVLIELGYAKKSLGPAQVVLLWNDAWGGCTPDDLPFDLRHRRAPLTYSLPEGASREVRERAERTLVSSLTAAISASLRRQPPPQAAAIEWPEPIGARADDPSVWFDAGTTLNVNTGTSWGADRVGFEEAPRSYVRVRPHAWPEGTRPEVVRSGGSFDILPLGDRMGLTWGPTRGGLIAFHSADRADDLVTCDTATQWFARNGELWGFDSRVVYEDGENPTLANVYVVECWARFLRRAADFYSRYDVKGPFKVEIGLTQLESVHWPKSGLFRHTQLGLEPAAQITIQLANLSEDQRVRALLAAHGAMLHGFGLPENEAELRKLLAETSRP